MSSPGPDHGKAVTFKESYAEPLLFLKHQDDKINRVLTALAFLTTAGVTLYIFSRSKSPADYPRFDNAHFTADDYFFAVFLVGIFLSVAFALVALDPTSFTPRFFPARKKLESILFYEAIARRSEEEWAEIFGESDTRLERRLARSFHEDARRLSNRAIHKVRRFGLSNVVVQFTVVALALLGIMRLNHVREDDRWWVAVIVLIVYSCLPLVDFLYFRILDFPGVGTDYVVNPWIIAMLFYVPFAAVSTAGLVLGHRRWQPYTVALAGTAILRLISSMRIKRLGEQQQYVSVGFATLLTVASAALLWCV